MQANYPVSANVSQPGGDVNRPASLTNFLDIVSSSPYSVIEDLLHKDAAAVHVRGQLKPAHKFFVNDVLSGDSVGSFLI